MELLCLDHCSPQISLSKPTLVGTGHPALKQRKALGGCAAAIAYAEARGETNDSFAPSCLEHNRIATNKQILN